jgi:hypothetical protein
VQVVDVPWTTVQIRGSAAAPGGAPVNYRAYSLPGDPFRILLQEPVSVDEALVFAKYAGFNAARESLLAVTGLDVLPELQPIDLFINATTWTGPYQPGVTTGFAGAYAWNSGLKTGYIALFDVEKENPVLTFTPENARRIEQQLLAIHEYTHELFYRRSFVSYEDFSKALSFHVCGYWDGLGTAPENFPVVTDPADPRLDSLNHGRLIFELAKHHGATWPLLRRSLDALARKFTAGGGEAEGQRVSANQYRWILNGLLASETKPAFLAAGFEATDFPTRTLYLPYLVDDPATRLSFRFTAAGAIGNEQGLLSSFDGKGKPHPLNLAVVQPVHFPVPGPISAAIHAVVLTAKAPVVLQTPAPGPVPTPPRRVVGWARFDSRVTFSVVARLQNRPGPLSTRMPELKELAIAGAKEFVLPVSAGDNTVAVVNPGHQQQTVQIALLRPRKLAVNLAPITLPPGQQWVATVTQLTGTPSFAGKIRITAPREIAAIIALA